MVRALLDGRKTMTRRLAWQRCKDGAHPPYDKAEHAPSPWQKMRAGDRLWVRENGLESKTAPLFRCFAHDATPGRYWVDTDGGRYGASYSGAITRESMIRSGSWKVRPSIHMPRWASRLTLLVTATKIERLQSITPADAIAEGIAPAANSQTIDCDTPNPVHGFRDLWNSLHGADAWAANPMVVALSFKVHKVNIDRMVEAA